jgi:hypothetical protein
MFKKNLDKRHFKLFGKIFVFIVLILAFIYYVLSVKDSPKKINYGATFSAPYARELGLDPQDVLEASLTDLGIKNYRLVAYWNEIEKEKGKYNFDDLDSQLDLLSKHDGKAVIAIGRRVPRWPECHIPDWAKKLSWEEQKKDLKNFLTEVVNRYKNNSVLEIWQVENEPYLNVYASEFCGSDMDEDFLKEEISLVKKIDSKHKVLVTDSGNLGLWAGAYKNGDYFGTSVYVYLWNPQLGKLKSFLPPSWYRVKENLMKNIYGEKRTFLIELSLEPWLTEPIVTSDIKLQLERMDKVKAKNIFEYAREMRFEDVYLWGLEWWYWLANTKGDNSMWQLIKTEINN